MPSPAPATMPSHSPPRQRTATQPRPAASWRAWWPWLAALLAVASAWWVGRTAQVEAGSDTGYWLGVAGGVIMVALFLYPLRKRVRWMRSMGATRHWFVFHMTLGVAGPWLILVHCNFSFGSLNAAVALISMGVVAGSGLIGRYLYVHVHRGLDGQRADLGELRAALDDTHERLAMAFALAPHVRQRLFEFEQTALAPATGSATVWRRAVRSGMAAIVARRDLRRLIDQALAASPKKLGRSQRHKIRSKWRAQVDEHLRQTLKVTQLAAWERLFALWHVLHLPFVYVMVLCAIAHVVAVHAY
ncbi:MAG: hypothetical protein IV094_04270 [Vitreoscilla sp.]|nr:hypothetical protein [Vitreoscilla sp.]